MNTIDEAVATFDCGTELRRLTKGMSDLEKIDYFKSLKPKIRDMRPSERLAYFKTLK